MVAHGTTERRVVSNADATVYAMSPVNYGGGFAGLVSRLTRRRNKEIWAVASTTAFNPKPDTSVLGRLGIAATAGEQGCYFRG